MNENTNLPTPQNAKELAPFRINALAKIHSDLNVVLMEAKALPAIDPNVLLISDVASVIHAAMMTAQFEIEQLKKL